ncbi:hypothetical protein AcW1_005900 [Taiwanofungus camphoratus]|nr:hypothetical protein AcV5_006215 [Antrodia cinnamomea]KAI0957542.1 hypothetical protein AcW1_005900 [Antrodia cinnamomea]
MIHPYSPLITSGSSELYLTRSLSFPGITWSSCRKRRTVAADREPVCSMDEYDPRHRHLTPLISRKQARWYDQY